jgi:uncharacterized protein
MFFAHNPFDELAEARPSSYHGWGIFAKMPIRKGTVWWQARPQDVMVIEQAQFETLAESAQPPLSRMLLDAILNYSYYPSGINKLILILDGGRFTNHSPTPNSLDDPFKLQSVALRDIAQGEEIVEDYTHFGQCPWAPLYGEFGKSIWG